MDERIHETPRFSRPFQVFVQDVHGDPNHGKARAGLDVVKFDKGRNFFNAAAALGCPKGLEGEVYL